MGYELVGIFGPSDRVATGFSVLISTNIVDNEKVSDHASPNVSTPRQDIYQGSEDHAGR